MDAQREVFEGKKKGGNRRGRQESESESDIDEGDLQFQKLEFNVQRSGTSAEDASQAKQRKKTKQVLLKEALKKKELAEGDAEGGSQVAWDKAFDRADGKKVFDDPKKLQKAIKREQKQKQKKTAKWKEIEAEQKQKQDEKQKKRRTNLADRTKAKIARKINRKRR